VLDLRKHGLLRKFDHGADRVVIVRPHIGVHGFIELDDFRPALFILHLAEGNAHDALTWGSDVLVLRIVHWEQDHGHHANYFGRLGEHRLGFLQSTTAARHLAALHANHDTGFSEVFGDANDNVRDAVARL
jgi:hypothetical protein